MSRRGAAIVGLSFFLLSACGGPKGPKGAGNEDRAASGAADSGKVLNLYIWSDYLAPNTLSDFERETGTKVNASYFDANEIGRAHV